MANIVMFFPKLMRLEGGEKYTETPGDKGGATKFGVTLAAWKGIGYDKGGDGDIDSNDIKLLELKDAIMALKVGYWDRWRADAIKNQSLAELLVDWVWTSGKWGIVIPQKVFGVEADGRVGMQTITAVNNNINQFTFDKIKEMRVSFTYNIVDKNPDQSKFLKGWLNRIDTFKFIN